ncbi:uncharacterized protein LOC115979622 [Quercus lobata]|uniref:uncharacterized protein LOC115979622 n=1 Tax=Quercus lobata TaxID=97700 RepID=UPI0012493829|nr:uncharacterized protein LOC115979622 [Quercus lobata]XP_030957537.1 uncharacterized protein LOC115979622 [Quercus lobata]
MLTMFNAYFGSPYNEKDLEGHYTNLWTQINDVKSLLDQYGFSWDDAKQMVVASHQVWDVYIKAHPDSRGIILGEKSIDEVNDLCIIYAHTTADGRYGLSSHDIDFDDDIQAVNMVIFEVLVKGDYKSPANNDPLRINWTREMVHYIMVLMSEQLHRGNKALKQLPREI